MTREAYVLSTGTALPGDPIGNDAVAARFGANAQWIDAFVGTKTRHFAVDLDTGAQTATLAELATDAARQAMAAADLDPADIDFLVLGTATPDHLMPTSANLVADALGIDQIPTFQLQSGCTGAIAALDLGQRLLSADAPTGLVIGADICVKHLRLDRDRNAAMSPSELINYVLFGDGAGATVLSYEPADAPMRLSGLVNRLTGLGREPGQQIEWFGLADRHGDEAALREDYKAIEKYVPQMSVEVLDELLRDAGIGKAELNYLCPPQLSGRMTDKIAAILDVPGAKEISVVAATGNNGNALPFLQLDALSSVIGAGERAAIVAIESSKWIKGGFLLEGL